MKLVFSEPEFEQSFKDWYNAGEHKDIKGNLVEPEDHPEIEAIIDFYNNEIAQGPAVEVKYGED